MMHGHFTWSAQLDAEIACGEALSVQTFLLMQLEWFHPLHRT